MDALDRTLRDRLARAGAEMSARPLGGAGLDVAPRRTLRPLVAAVGLAVVLGAVGGGLSLHGRLSARHATPAGTPAPLPTPAPVPTATPTPSAQPAPFTDASVVWDSTHRQVVAYQSGFQKGSGDYVHLWTWDGTWREVGSPGGPEPTDDGVLVDVPTLHGVVLLGADPTPATSSGPPGSWLWDGSAWRPMPHAGFPSCFAPTAAAWDARRGEIVTILGDRCSNTHTPPAEQTWWWDRHAWHRGPDLASCCDRPLLAWDAGQSTVVMLGAQSLGNTAAAARESTWTGSGWHALTTRGSGAYPQWPVGAAWDAQLGAVVMYGSSGADSSGRPELVSIRNGVWTEIHAATYPPQALAVMSTDSGEWLLLGQEPVAIIPNGTRYDSGADFVLTWDRSAWRHATPAELATPS
jgi:hypothetical protein